MKTFLQEILVTYQSITAITLPVILLISIVFYRKFGNKPILPPGPTRLPIIGNLHLLSSLPHRSLCNLARKYGPVMTVYFGSLLTIVISSPQLAKQVLKSEDHIFGNRPLFGDVNHNDDRYEKPTKIAFAQSGPYWKLMRKTLTTELLSPKRVEFFKFLRAEEALAMIRSIFETAASNVNGGSASAVNIAREVSIFINNIVCRMTFGRKCGEDELGGKIYKEALDELLALQAGFNARDFIPLLNWLSLKSPTPREAEIAKLFSEFLESMVEEHFEKRKESSGLQYRDFVDILVSLCEDESAELKITRENIKDVVYDILAAGTDTSGNTLEWAMSELLRNPSTMEIAQQELDSVVGQNRMVEESDLGRLPYLQSVVKEILRLYPPAPLLIPRESMEHSTIAGYRIPHKTRVIVNVWAIGRDPTAWEEADKFKPERFMGSQIDVKGQDFEVLPFGAGRRGCPGVNLGLCMTQLGLAWLLHSFNWHLPQGVTPETLDMSEVFGLTLPKAMHLHAIPVPRLPLNLYHSKA
uniref:Cytochrome P450 n=1 Tax=Araucaria cunninghamii TaxID=56994 RepID=A0A0D6QTZ0_ARACU